MQPKITTAPPYRLYDELTLKKVKFLVGRLEHWGQTR